MSMDTQATTGGQSDESDHLSLVDCDVHPYHVPDEIDEYMPEEYADYDFAVPHGNWSNPHDGFRGDAKPETGGIPGSDPALLRQHVMEENGTDYPILTAAGVLLLAASPQFDYAHALARGFNDWLVEKWLDFDDHFVGALAVAPQRPKQAAEMIREYGEHPQIRQVIMGSATEHPFGRQFYWPIYEACEEMGLPMAVHPGSVGHGICPPPTGAGYPTTFFESHVDAACHYISNLVSLVAEGVFVEYPDFEWVFLEGGFTWAPSAMWRMDQNWERGKEEVPHLEKPPSEYVREHCYFGTQPIPEPDDWADLQRTIEIMHGEDTLVYCSDYPHWDTDDRDHGIPPLPDEVEKGMYYGNAQELYDLPSDGSGLR
jgi:predicted TIM-barrel fold metal-dependent hydrolase